VYLTSSMRGVGWRALRAAARCSSGNGLRRSCHENALRMQYAADNGPAAQEQSSDCQLLHEGGKRGECTGRNQQQSNGRLSCSADIA